MTPRLRLHRSIAALVAVAAFLAACSGDDGGPTIDDGESVVTTEVAAGGDDFDVDDDELEASIEDFYRQFLFAADQYRVPAEGAEPDGEFLETAAAPTVVDQFDAARELNESYGDGFQRITEQLSETNILDIEVDGDVARIDDCTRQTKVTIDDQRLTNFVTHEVTIVNDDGLFQVTEFDIVHDGDVSAIGYGCLPPSLADEAAETAETAVSGFLSAQASPAGGLGTDVRALFDGDLEVELLATLQEQANQNVSLDSPFEVATTTLGSDPRGLGLVAAVTACITYPQGLDVRDLDSGEVRRQVFPPGSQNEVTYSVRFDDAGPVLVGTISEELSTSC